MKSIYKNPEKSVKEALDSAVLIEDFLPSPAELVRKTTKDLVVIFKFHKFAIPNSDYFG